MLLSLNYFYNGYYGTLPKPEINLISVLVLIILVIANIV